MIIINLKFIIIKLSITKRNFSLMNQNIFYFNRQKKIKPSFSFEILRTTKKNQLPVPYKNKIKYTKSLPKGHFLTI